MNYKIITAIGLAGSAWPPCSADGISFCRPCCSLWQWTGLQGVSLLPAVFGKSPKSEKGTLESRAGWKGLCRKAMTLFYVLIAARLDALMGTDYLRDAVCIGFIANEALSIIENAGLMGLPLRRD